MMKSSVSGPPLLLLFLLILGCTGFGLGSVVWKSYFYNYSHYTWLQAQNYCRHHYTDLAIIYTQADEEELVMNRYNAWIGLTRDTDNLTFRWYWSDGRYNYLNYWASHEPDDGENCAVIDYKYRRFYGSTCDEYYFYFCHKHHPSHYEHEFIPQSKTWSDARESCRSKGSRYDLASFLWISEVPAAVTVQDFPVWTGLHREARTWTWSGGMSEYFNWASNEPGQDNCVSISSTTKEMATKDCSARFPFVCFKDNLILVKENKTWEEALEHCRALTYSSLRYELVSVQPGDDHNYMMHKVLEAETDEVWTGLRFLAGEWLWVNMATVAYPDLPLCPSMWQECGALSKNDMGSIETKDCTETRNFLCYTY